MSAHLGFPNGSLLGFPMTTWKFLELCLGFSSEVQKIVVSNIRDAAIISISPGLGEQVILCDAGRPSVSPCLHQAGQIQIATVCTDSEISLNSSARLIFFLHACSEKTKWIFSASSVASFFEEVLCLWL